MRIEFLNKAEADLILPKLFDILYSNMSVIAPTGNSYEEDFSFWLSCVKPSLQKDPRQILLIYDKDEIVGFFQYFVNRGLFMMEEIQFTEKYKVTGIFRELYSYLTEIIPRDTEFVEAYADKRNKKSIEVLTHLGLEIIGENKNKVSYHFRGRYENILSKYGTK
ncbi:MAG: hypothetical protein E7627_01270 [Ruminococcaceae bacterium]|nr:hypothetical protein [Oscillospiraceae bacterium]